MGVDGLTSCTESLGFESCDSGEFYSTAAGDGDVRWRDRIRERRRRREAGKVKKFLPPNKNGQPNCFLRPVRRNRRLELTEVRIDRPEVLKATKKKKTKKKKKKRKKKRGKKRKKKKTQKGSQQGISSA
ncbi:hypothetical protein LINPERHAP2_LOCUS6354 [Linum perenne]